MTSPRRSPHAHGPDTECGHCQPCPACTGHTPPLWYRLLPNGGHQCTRCQGTGRACHNRTPNPVVAGR